ncbi:MAG TPA: hypothetical protein PLY97_06630 [Acidocella sp.]|nr:hypothetical protein [Acidocella sp.]
MTYEEHTAIRDFIQDIVNNVDVPMDVEADAIIRALFKCNPDAAYRVTMLAMSLLARPAANGAQAETLARAQGRGLRALLRERWPLNVPRGKPVVS